MSFAQWVQCCSSFSRPGHGSCRTLHKLLNQNTLLQSPCFKQARASSLQPSEPWTPSWRACLVHVSLAQLDGGDSLRSVPSWSRCATEAPTSRKPWCGMPRALLWKTSSKPWRRLHVNGQDRRSTSRSGDNSGQKHPPWLHQAAAGCQSMIPARSPRGDTHAVGKCAHPFCTSCP